MSTKRPVLNEKPLLEKNPQAARIFKNNRKKLGGRPPSRPAKEYGLGLPYGRAALVSMNGNDEEERERA